MQLEEVKKWGFLPVHALVSSGRCPCPCAPAPSGQFRGLLQSRAPESAGGSSLGSFRAASESMSQRAAYDPPSASESRFRSDL